MVRIIASTRIIAPNSRIRLSAGRKDLSKEAQLLCFVVGANSIFYGDTLLTTENNDMLNDKDLIAQYNNHHKDILNSKGL
jgi:biotin synthase